MTQYYLKILHCNLLTRCLPFLHIMTGIRSFLQKWHNTVIPATDNRTCILNWQYIPQTPCLTELGSHTPNDCYKCSIYRSNVSLTWHVHYILHKGLHKVMDWKLQNVNALSTKKLPHFKGWYYYPEYVLRTGDTIYIWDICSCMTQ